MLRPLSVITICASLMLGCSKATYSNFNLPNSVTIVPPWYSNFPELPNSFGFKNLGTASSPSVLYLSDNVAYDGDILSIALNGQVVRENITIATPDVSPPHAISMALNKGPNRVDVLCVHDPGGGCTLQAEISNTTAGQGLTTINDQPIPEGESASFIVEFKPGNAK